MQRHSKPRRLLPISWQRLLWRRHAGAKLLQWHGKPRGLLRIPGQCLLCRWNAGASMLRCNRLFGCRVGRNVG